VYEADNASVMNEENTENCVIIENKNTKLKRNKLGYGLTLTYCNGKGPLHALGVMDKCIELDTPSLFHWIFDSKGHMLGYYGHRFIDSTDKASSKEGASTSSPNSGSAVDPKDVKMAFTRGNLRIPRALLRKLLYDVIENKEQVVSFGKSLRQIEETEEGVNLLFTDGVSESCDICIGADGIRSMVRRHRDVSFDQLSVSTHKHANGTQTLCSSTRMSPSQDELTTARGRYQRHIDEMCLSNRSLGLQYLHITVIIGISKYVPPALTGVDITTDGGFYVVDGVNRLFVMPYQETRSGNSSTGRSEQLTMWQLSFSDLTEQQGLECKYPFCEGDSTEDEYFKYQCSNYLKDARRRMGVNGLSIKHQCQHLMETISGLIEHTPQEQVRNL